MGRGPPAVNDSVSGALGPQSPVDELWRPRLGTACPKPEPLPNPGSPASTAHVTNKAHRPVQQELQLQAGGEGQGSLVCPQGVPRAAPTQSLPWGILAAGTEPYP